MTTFKMNILITGGAGFIGSNLAVALQEKGHDVTIIDNFSSGNIKNLHDFKIDQKNLVIEGDVVNRVLDSEFFKNTHFDVIFHLASITDTTLTDENKMIYTNVNGFKNILKFAKSKSAKLIYASSAAVYGRGKKPMQENQELAPLGPYAISKAMIDKIAMEEKNDEITIVGLRYFNVYGMRESYKGKSASMIWQLYCRMKAGKKPRIFKWGQQFRDFIYIKDVTEFHLRLLQTEISSCILNVACGVPTTFNKIIELLNQNLNTNYEPEYFDNPYLEFYQDETLADVTKAQQLVGFKAKYSIEDGIRDYVEELKKAAS